MSEEVRNNQSTYERLIQLNTKLILPTVPFTLAVHSYQDALAQAEYYQQTEDWGRWHYFQRLIATADGRYSFRQPNLNEVLVQAGLISAPPLTFKQWVEGVWGSAV